MDRHVVIVGGGVIGSAIASFTLADPAFRGTLTIIERDPSYARASSALSASSIRQQFSTAINIKLSQFGIEFLRHVGEHLGVGGERPEIGLVEPGYLFLATEAGRETLQRNHALQCTHDVAVALLDPQALRSRFPWLSTDGVAMGSLGLSGEGWFDGYSLMQAFRRHARSRGARYLTAEVAGFDASSDRVSAAVLADNSHIAGDAFVNAAGPWAANVARWLDIELPVRARRRCVFLFSCLAPIERCPLVIDSSGVWFRPEGERQFICGVSPDPSNDPDDAPLDIDHALFENTIWPSLAARVPAFESLRQTQAWAGYYEFNTYDHNGIVGAHPKLRNLYFANGFSGHGLQQAPAVGRGMAELLVHGAYRSLDLSPLRFERIAEGRPVVELNVV